MSNTIYDLANNLERALRQLPEYQAVVEAKETLEHDKAAFETFQKYLTFQQDLQALFQSGQSPDQEKQKQMQELGEKIQATPILADYLNKQQQLSIYLSCRH